MHNTTKPTDKICDLILLPVKHIFKYFCFSSCQKIDNLFSTYANSVLKIGASCVLCYFVLKL
jgi:hypothetical protein